MPKLKHTDKPQTRVTRPHQVVDSGITKSTRPAKVPKKLTLSDVANTLKVSYHKNNNAKKAQNTYLDLMFQNLSSTNKPKKVVDDETFELLKFARVVSAWVRRNMPLAPCNKEFSQQLEEFELSLAAHDYLINKSKNLHNDKLIKQVGSGTCKEFTELALAAILSNGNIDNLSAILVELSDKEDKNTHIVAVIRQKDNPNNEVVIDAHSENAEPCLLADVKDKLNELGYTNIIGMKYSPTLTFKELDNTEFSPTISQNYKNKSIISSSFSKNVNKIVKTSHDYSSSVSIAIQNSQAYLIIDSNKLKIDAQPPQVHGIGLNNSQGKEIAHLGNLIRLNRDDKSKFIFLDTTTKPYYFAPFDNIFSDIPYQYTNSKGETIPSGEEIMNINN